MKKKRHGTKKAQPGKVRHRSYAAVLLGMLFCLAGLTEIGQEPLTVRYQGKFNTTGWSEQGNAHSPCLQGDGYLSDLRLSLVNYAEGTEGELIFQGNVQGTGWLDENIQERGAEPVLDSRLSENEAPLEGVRLWLTGELEREYDLYYRVYQNGRWQPWKGNGQDSGLPGEGLWISGLQVMVQKKGTEPPEDDPEEEEVPAVDPSRPMVALTFDDGPRASVTDRILQYLQEAGGRATFFMIGNRVAANEKSVNQMVAQGCQVANHTFDHQYISKLDLAEMQQQIGGTSQAILDACGILPTAVRPPGGKINEESLAVLETMGLPVVMWSIDTRDWQHRDARQTVEIVLSEVKDGDIVLMHDIYPSTADAAAVLIPALTERGYQLVTVSELAMYRGGMLPGRRYSRFSPVSAE